MPSSAPGDALGREPQSCSPPTTGGWTGKATWRTRWPSWAAGRPSRLVRGKASTGAADDLASATSLATQMVREFGLSEQDRPAQAAAASRAVTWCSPPGLLRAEPNCSLDQEIAALLTTAETRARELLPARQALDLLTSALLEQETITGDQVVPCSMPPAQPRSPATGACGPCGLGEPHISR